MSANLPLRLLSIDPGLAHMGMVVVGVVGINDIRLLEQRTVHTSPKTPFLERLQQLMIAVGEMSELAATGTVDGWWVVIEDPRGVVQSDARGKEKDPRRIADLVAAFGVIAADVCIGLPGTPEEQSARTTLVPVTKWYPRTGRSFAKKERLLQRIHARHGLEKASEHACMAFAIAEWWSANVAPAIWYQRNYPRTPTSQEKTA